ncbi:hypothetical protein [Paenibacillus sp. GXUN7292]|uniref:hypothetical protein n=1 Tax=Paenibacillus sp. GXUN7292 TaxID=3422499 RepID=UPI003D7E2D13
MKRTILILFIIGATLTACSGNNEMPKPSPTSSPVITVSQEPIKEVPSPEPSLEPSPTVNDAESVLNAYMTLLLEKKYDELLPMLYEENIKMRFGASAEDWMKDFKENDFKKSIERTEFLISSINDYDANHKLAKYIVKGTLAGSSDIQSAEEFVGLVFVNGEWKIDFTLIVNHETLHENGLTTQDGTITINKIDKVKTLRGYDIYIQMTNNEADKQLLISQKDVAVGELKTDKGSSKAELGRLAITPNESGLIILNFETEPSEAQSLLIKNLQFFDKNKLPIGELFELDIPLK